MTPEMDLSDGTMRRPADAHGPHIARLRFDTLGGTPYVLALTLLRDRTETVRALYGLAADPAHFTDDFARVVRDEPLLPRSLVGLAPNDSIIRLRVSHPAIGTIYKTVSAPPAGTTTAAVDTVDAWLGGLVITLALRPKMAQSLLIGGLPSPRLPLYLGLLGLAALLALVALIQLRRARELERLRARFVTNVSHELRTPLAQISMFGETLMLDRERSLEERHHFLGIVLREARRLTNLVNGVLHFSRADAGIARLVPEPRDIAAEVRDTVEGFSPLAAASGVTVRTVVNGPAPALVDPGGLRQVLLNLLDNAVKYGPRGQTVTVRVARASGEIVVSVQDQGPGIPAADRLRVFEPFTRLEGPAYPRASGAGIGLSVVRELVTAHGGRVWVQDAAEMQGAIVSFTLPVS